MTAEDQARWLARLAHDVGKYVARTARNIPDGPVPEVLVGMLARDLYELEEGKRASQVLEARLGETAAADEQLRCAVALLQEADALEGPVRLGEPGAVRRAASIAVEVSELLRAAARGASSAGTDGGSRR